MATNILGKVMLTMGGAFSVGATYTPLTLVDYNGSSYIAKATVTGIIPGVSANWATYWQPSASKGNPGDPGSGRSIVDVELTSTVGLVDTYTITYDAEPLTSTFDVTNGEQGERGTETFSGSVITGTSTTPTAYATGITLAIVNDRYRNTDTLGTSFQNEYKCTLGGDAATALWVYDQNVRGEPGTGNVNTVNGVLPDGAGDVTLTAEDVNALPQYDTMPTPIVGLVGSIVQFTGTTGTYTNGYTYICQSDGGSGYEWVAHATGDYATPAQAALKADLTVVSATYSAASTYAIGVFCTYNNLFYECTTAIETPEAWTIGHWTERTVGYVLTALNTSKAGTSVATTSANGLAPQATAPSSGLHNYLGIDNGETQYSDKALFDTTDPSTQTPSDTAAVGTASVAARRDHKHAMSGFQAAATIAANTDASPALGTVANNHEYRCTNTSLTTSPTLTIASIASISAEFACVVIYKAPNATAPVVTNNSGYSLKYKGDSVSGGTYTPVSGTTYRLSFLFDGIYLNCYVVGVA